MGCTKCKTETCDGCGEQPLSINNICNPIDCPVEECSESFNANCTFYTGPDIICDNVVVVPSGTSMAQAIANMNAYFCVQTTAVPALRKTIITGSFVDADHLTITIPKATLTACGIPTIGCHETVAAITDFIIQGYFLSDLLSMYVKFTELDKTVIKVTPLGDIEITVALVPAPVTYPIPWRLIIIG